MIFTVCINNHTRQLIELKDGWEIDKTHCSPDGQEYLLKLFSDACPYHIEDLTKGFFAKCWEDANLGRESEEEIQKRINNFIEGAEIQQ